MSPLSKKPRSEKVYESLRLLEEGNQRFSQGLRSIETMLSALRLKDLAEKGQSPFAILVTCSDSRLPAEIVFDRGVGDLFVVRMAGNIITSEVLASIEFAATQFKTPLCLVMGHSRCGAMEEAVKILGKKTAPATPLLGALVDNFKTPFIQTKKAVQELTEAHLCKQEEVDFTTALTHFNVHHGVEEVLRRSPILSDLAAQGEFAAIGAYYSLSTGKVTFLPEGDDQRLAQALGTGEVPVDGIVTRKS